MPIAFSHPWEVVAGGMQSCARLVDGSLRCWGHRIKKEDSDFDAGLFLFGFMCAQGFKP